jgi:outer membrane lipoprotein-sorting protein
VKIKWQPVALLLLCSAATPASQPTTSPADAELWADLHSIDARASQIHSLSANFEQRKFTALLNKPLVSTGQIRILGDQIRWDTLQPQRSVLWMDQHEVRIYYPDQKVLEVYTVDQRLADLASSPLPKLDVLKREFSIERSRPREFAADPTQYLNLRLLPTDPSLREHVQEVFVSLDVKAAYINMAEVTDSDGERTVLSFSNVSLNPRIGDLTLAVPPDTRITHPLQALEGASSSQGRSK